MRKLICIAAMCVVFFYNMIALAVEEKVEIKENEIVYVEAIPIEIESEPVIEEIKVIETEPIKTEAEIKQEEFYNKLYEIEHLKEENKEEWFTAYKDLTYEYVEWIEQPETVFDAFTEDEVRLICRVVETETYDQPFNEKANVASVVFNRLEDGGFGDTVTEVITTPRQFAYGRKNITDSTILAVMYAYEIEDTTNGALYFNSFEEPPEIFNKAKYIFSDNAVHHFYKP